MHTSSSFDAFTVGVMASWADAYKFAMGEEIELSTTGEKMKRRTPYDFVAITDHSEYYGVLKEFADPDSPLSKSDLAKTIMNGKTNPEAAMKAVGELIGTLTSNSPMPEYVTPELRKSKWADFVAAADKYNKPGEFTTL